MNDTNSVARRLDERHAAARRAYSLKDVDGYADIFSPDLEYRRADGEVISRSKLMRNVKTQFRRLASADTTFVRESIAIDDEGVTEVLCQTARAEAISFGFIRRVWILERRGRYAWAMQGGEWKIARVEVLSEHQRSGGWKFG